MKLFFILKALVFLLAVLMRPFVEAAVPVWSNNFEEGVAGVRTYRSDEPITRFELASDRPASGGSYLRAVLPGERSLEGVNVRASGVSGERTITATAMVRGKGDLRLCLNSPMGWLYSPATVSLTDTWQEVSLSKALPAGTKDIGVHFLSFAAQPGAVFEIDDVNVYMDEPPLVYDREAGPVALPAADYLRDVVSRKVEEPSSKTGFAVRTGRYFHIRALPFPRTSRPVYISLRVNPGVAGEAYRLNAYPGGARQVIESVQSGAAGEWQWLRFSPVKTSMIGDTFGIDISIPAGEYGHRLVDRVVISSRELSEKGLESAAVLEPARPLARVHRCAEPPVIDGRGNDPCWEDAVALTGFMEVRTTDRVEAQTSVRFLYDDRNLYALFECEEPILEIVAQRTHEFRARMRERNEDVFRDDSAALLLDPGKTGARVYDFFTNALGTVQDALCEGEDLWASRDISWNSGVEAAGYIGDGYWRVEMAIPFADLGGAPSAGDVWGATVGRIARAGGRSETSSWNHCPLGFHDGLNMGGLLFGGDGPGVKLDYPDMLEVGVNHMKAEINSAPPGGAGVYLVSEISEELSVKRAYSFAGAGGEMKTAEHEVLIASEGDVNDAYSVLDAASLSPLYLTPRISKSVRSTYAEAVISTAGAYELYLNGRLVKRGTSAEAEKISAPLRKGANVFALKVEEGRAAVRITPPGMQFAAGAWKTAPADTSGAFLPETDDSTWATAHESGGVYGKEGEPAVLRQTLLWEETRQWPSPDPAFHIARGAAQHLTFILPALEGRRLDDFTLYIAVPPEFEILGSTGYYGHNPGIPNFHTENLGIREIEGGEVNVARVRADEPVRTGRHYIMSLFNMFVRYREESGEPGGEDFEFIYWTEANDRTVVEPPQSFPVRVLGKLDGGQPEKLVWMMWGSFYGAMNKPEMREEVLKTISSAGFNKIVGGGRWASENGPRYGVRHTRGGMNFVAMQIHDYLREHPDMRLIKSDGTPWKVRYWSAAMCTTALLNEGWEGMEAVIANEIERHRPHAMDYDFEYGPYKGSHHSCHCPRCLEEFRDYSGLPDDVEISVETTGDEYWEHSDKWVDFYAWRSAKIMRRFKETIHSVSPGTKFSVYSGYNTPQNPRQYGINWRYIGDLDAVDYGICGYGRPVPAVFDTVEAMQGIPVVYSAIITPYRVTETWPLRPVTKAVLLRRLVDSRGGVMVYAMQPVDGRTLLASAGVSRVAAEYEEAFLSGERGAIGGVPEAEITTVTLNGETLVCVMNGTAGAREWSFTLPSEWGGGHEFYSGRRVEAGQAVSLKLEPGEIAVYILRK